MMSENDRPSPPSPTDEAQRAADLRARRQAARASSVGIQFGVSIAIGAGFGYWLDSTFNTSPWLLLIGLTFGVIAAFRELYILAKKSAEEPDPPSP